MRECIWFNVFFFFQAEDGIRVLVRSRGLGDVYKRQLYQRVLIAPAMNMAYINGSDPGDELRDELFGSPACLLYTSDAADDLLCVDIGGRRIIKKKN